MSQTRTSAPDAIEDIIREFLGERLQFKLDKLKEGEDGQRQKLLDEHRTKNWIADAARRVGRIQQVTHALKYTHPDARGSSLNSAGNPKAGEFEIGTHTLADGMPFDVVGNAASLDVYKFLRLDIDGKTILERAVGNDPALAAAFSDDAEEAGQWMAAFAAMTRPRGKPASHGLAKQVYWPVGGGEYHLLAPLFPSSLAHVVWNTIRGDLFSDAARAAREARRAGVAHPRGYREYPGLAVRKFGGANPQNISQLNSERHGENYLLSALPPCRSARPIGPPLHMASVFGRLFGSRRAVRRLTGALRDFSAGAEGADRNLRIRGLRAELASGIRDELFQFAAELHELEPGWSQAPECRLNLDERCWLDPGRAEHDQAFAALCRRGDWQEGICRRFGVWLNARLASPQVTMGEDEARHWQSVLDHELRMIRTELAA